MELYYTARSQPNHIRCHYNIYITSALAASSTNRRVYFRIVGVKNAITSWYHTGFTRLRPSRGGDAYTKTYLGPGNVLILSLFTWIYPQLNNVTSATRKVFICTRHSLPLSFISGVIRQNLATLFTDHDPARGSA